VTAEWMGEAVETLADLLEPGLRAVCVGINPAPVSVRAGHYYQSRLGQAFLARLKSARLLSIDAHVGRTMSRSRTASASPTS
jgi:TDG/mug DNA glycosylase family protein